jgi:hypothetical protein
MKVACLIITYTSAAQTMRLIKKLSNGHFDFYIHLDKKVPLETHAMLFGLPNVFFVHERVDVQWGTFSSIRATVNGIKQIESSGIPYDYVHLMSGQDYPIKSPSYIINFLEKHNGSQFIHYLDFKDWPGAQVRLERYYLNELKFRGRFRLGWLLNKLFGKRKIPAHIKPYGFATFWTLTLDCALYIPKALQNDPALERFFKYTFGSDEYIYPTIIMNSSYKDAVVNNNYRYTDWSAGGFRPKLLVAEDFERMAASDCLFARKMDINVDKEIFDLIDNFNSGNN